MPRLKMPALADGTPAQEAPEDDEQSAAESGETASTYVPPASTVDAYEAAKRRMRELEGLMKAPPVVVKPKRYRVVGLPIGGTNYQDASGRLARLVPNKILDERYFPIEHIRNQGFQLVECDERDMQIGLVR